jgi:hypothetical protein
MTPFQHIAQALFQGQRGIGRTHKMITEAPQGATILCCNHSHAHIMRQTAVELGRPDLKTHVPEDDNMIGLKLGRCVADHGALETWFLRAAMLADKERETREELQKAEQQIKVLKIKQSGLATVARPADEWHEDMGDVVWWYFKDGKVQEAPYIGSPLDCGQKLGFEVAENVMIVVDKVGGWPGYHTHFTPLPPVPELP